MPKKPFKGVIKLDIRDSKPDWEPFMLPRAPEGSPNVLIVLYDDTGLAAWSPMGGGINMPTLQKLADRPGAAGIRLEHVLARQGSQRARVGHRLRREPQRMAAAEGLRSLLRIS